MSIFLLFKQCFQQDLYCRQYVAVWAVAVCNKLDQRLTNSKINFKYFLQMELTVEVEGGKNDSPLTTKDRFKFTM